MVTNILIDNLSGIAPLFHRYPGQTSPQPAYIEMTEDGEVSADYSGEIGNAVPMYVWHGRTLRWSVPSDVRGEALAEFLADPETLALLERVHAGHVVDWDGNNHVGSLSDDARDASEGLDRLIERELIGAEAAVRPVGDWLWSSCTLLQHWQNQPLAEAVREIEDGAEIEGVLLDGDIEDELLDMAAHWLETGRAGLTSAHITALIEHGQITDDEATEYAVR
jgi:hypothetical protein